MTGSSEAVRAVAWDIDGTLIDSEPLHHRALVAVCRDLKVDLSGVTDETFCGVHMKDVWRHLRSRAPSELEEARWLAAIESYYVEHRSELAPIEGAREVIAKLAERGLRQCCVSNSGRTIVDANLDVIGVGEAIEFSISLDDVKAGKPSPEPYLQAARRLSLAPRELMAVEDSATGLESARLGGLRSCAFGLKATGADHLIDRLEELLKIVD